MEEMNNRFAKDWMRELLNESVEDVLNRIGLITEKVVTKKTYRARVNGLRIHLVENWCLCKWCQLFDPECENFAYWASELKACIDSLKNIDIEDGISKRRELRMIFLVCYEYNIASMVERAVRGKFEREGISEVDSCDSYERECVCKEFADNIIGLIDVISKGTIDTDEYIQNTFSLGKEKLVGYKKHRIHVQKKNVNNPRMGATVKDAVVRAKDNVINEGIDFDRRTKIVSYNPSHEENVDTSIEHNPTMDGGIVPNVQVWSIFKRKRGLCGDGNPLVYALKGEGGWRFRDESDRIAIEQQFDAIATKFATKYTIGVTILMPSGSELNEHIADVVMSKSKNAELIEGAICKLTTEEVDDIVMDFSSKFREFYKGKDVFNSKYKEFSGYLDLMDKERNGSFSRHLIKDPQMRDVLDFTLKVSDDRFAEFANQINGQNILIIDDTISRGQSIKEACRIMLESYAPKSITVLTLLSKSED